MALGIAVIILFAIVVVVVGYFIVKNLLTLVINSILGLITLFLVNSFHVMSLLGKPDIAINWVSLLICALGGLPGALILILLHLLGYGVPAPQL
jgi:hypothetical protein